MGQLRCKSRIAIGSSRRVVLDNELALIDDCIDITGTVPIGGGSATEQFHVDLPQGGGNASLQNVLALRATGVMMEVGVPDPLSPDAGTQPTNPPHDFPQVPEFSFYNYDHLGNTRVLYHNYFTSCTPGGARYVLEHVLDYYPYGRSLREYILTRDRFQTTYHERDEESMLDYRGARFYDGDIGVFLSCDPLAVDFAAWSTYNYVLGNPVRFVDPTGKSAQSPIFDPNGNYLGTDTKGYTGEIIIMSSKSFNILTGNGKWTLSHESLSGLIDDGVASNMNDAGINAEAFSKIYTHVVKKMEGEKFKGKTISFDNLEGGIINTINTENSEDGLYQINGERFGNPLNPPINAIAEEKTNSKGKHNVTTRLLFGRGQMTTVEETQSILGIHEYFGHGVLGIGGGREEHKAYQLQVDHKRTFDKLSDSEQYKTKKYAKVD